jgi:glycosyltransferase involved in cell wall biosynthesis
MQQHGALQSVSVVIPTYNSSATIQAAVASARAQSLRPLEIIVVDDASTDDTTARLNAIAGRDLVVIRKTVNAGGGAARNRGIERARGDVVAFLDADDLWAPHKLAMQTQMLRTHGGPAFCFSAVTQVNEYAEKHVLPRRAPHAGESLADYMLKYGNIVQTSTLAVPRHLLDQCHFNPHLRRFQDVDFVLRLAAAGNAALYVPEPLVEWRNVGNPRRVSSNANHALIRMFLDQQPARLTFAQRLGLEIRSFGPTPGALGTARWLGRLGLSVCTGALAPTNALSLLLKYGLGLRHYAALRSRLGVRS